MDTNEEDTGSKIHKKSKLDTQNGSSKHQEDPQRRTNKLVLIWLGGILSGILAAAAGFLIGWFTAGMLAENQSEIFSLKNNSELREDWNVDWKQDFDPVISQQLRSHIRTESIRENLKWLTAMPRVAGTPADKLQANAMKAIWRSQGLDTSGLESYEVLMSYPGNRSYPNTIKILSEAGQVVYEAPWKQEDERLFNVPGFQPHTPPYGAYCESTVVQAKNAAEAGAAAILVFPDPYTNAPLGDDNVHPKNWWLPRDGVQSGAVKNHFGDTLTPGYAAKDYAFRETLTEARKVLCPLPLQPISYEVAHDLLNHVHESTPKLPDAWTYHFPVTGLSNKHHHLGGAMKNNRKVRVEINNKLEKRKIYNAFGMVLGKQEPDRIVIMGGHRDAWGNGAMDPGGGTAVMLEASAAIGKQLKLGWRPRRTLIFASWGAEEFGMIGSTEWVQERIGLLTHKAIAYINLDIVVTGNIQIEAAASPLLGPLLLEVTQQVPHPRFRTLFEAWQNFTHARSMSMEEPKVDLLKPYSDFVPFYYLAGIPSVDVHMSGSQGLYPAYHTQYDTFDYVAKHVDPGFIYHGMMAQVFTGLLYHLSDSLIIPFDVRNYGNIVLQAHKKFSFNIPKWVRTEEGQHKLNQLQYCVHNFSYAMDSFAGRLDSMVINSPYQQRQINDQLMLLERAFIDQIWETDKHSLYKHVLMSPNKYGRPLFPIFPGVNDALCQKEVLEFDDGDVISLEAKQEIDKQFATVCHALNRAVDMVTM